MLVALVAVLSVAFGQTIPAVYYSLYFVNRDNTTGLNQVETIDSNGGGRAVIYSGFTDLLSDSLAFDGTYLYVVEGEECERGGSGECAHSSLRTGNDTVVRLTAQIPSSVIDLIVHPGVTCVGIGKADSGTGRPILYYGVSSPLAGETGPNVLWRSELNGTDNRAVTTWPNTGACKYVIQQQKLVFWTSDDGFVYYYNTSTSSAGNLTVLPQSAPQGNATGGITSAQSSNVMLYGVSSSGAPSIASNQLDMLLGQVPGTPTLNQWTNFTAANNTFCLITLNGAVVVSTDVGVNFYFGSFTASGKQTLSRQILVNVSSIRGLATNAASALAASALLLMVVFLAAL